MSFVSNILLTWYYIKHGNQIAIIGVLCIVCIQTPQSEADLDCQSAVRENASFGRSDDVTILLFRPKISENKRKKMWAL